MHVRGINCVPNKFLGTSIFQFSHPGASGEREIPVPIPNTEVKPLSADGS